MPCPSQTSGFNVPNYVRRCDEQETLPHVLGFCHHGELLRINIHNTVRSLIAASLRQNASYEVYEEVGCVSSDGSTRRADIIIIDRQKDKGVILDPTIRFEMHEQQPQEDDNRSVFGNLYGSSVRVVSSETGCGAGDVQSERELAYGCGSTGARNKL
ncbi:hypothetical protein ANN_00963 [Periplaneta americana]|uniref:Uncharacterized protein n=1 Tax=Periplaneta americana TaxID=6978 RepID=A0ABQ8TS89_PERAM|nr:hypothetical protein ANN_00963 [Periplaneta americana]